MTSRHPLLRSFGPPALAIVAVAMSAAFVLPSAPRASALFLAARALVFFWAGARAVAVAGATPLVAAACGPALYFVDEVLLKGSCYVARAAYAVGPDRHALLAQGAGVIGTWALFAVIPAVLAFAGGTLASRRAREDAAAA